MRLLSIGRRDIVRLAILILLPLCPLTLTMIPLRDMVDRLIHVLV